MRGDGRVFRRGPIWYIAYYRRGRDVRVSAGKVLGLPPRSCTEDDAYTALQRRVRQRRYAAPESPARRLGLPPHTLAVVAAANSVLGPVPVVVESDELRALCGPIVYAYFRDGKPLYVGVSGDGLGRPFAPSHHRLAGLRREFLGDIGGDDHLVVWPCASITAAQRFEHEVIAALRPSLNGDARIVRTVAAVDEANG